ncbi:hypothetical protein [Ktedonobacter racemifer]|uniref:Uncharacterized protein n=1 Tax=Ktedonobacter racemifer DSM 44963 TaxID=485913 RepID=D6U699_KTERA|nr:hypothetical protein [Ktedonobacter racemifer]EFH80510.1 hypothetical protein Krac_1119 [Ktedonobacter racemifer DSM 44963]
MHITNQSEVAHLLDQIQMQYQAAHNGLHRYAMVAQHRMRTTQTERIGILHQELQQIVGEDEAIQLVAQALDQL